MLAKVAPPIGNSDAAEAYLKKRFPRNIERLRDATEAEAALMKRAQAIKAQYDDIEAAKGGIENELRLAIGDADGICSGGTRVTWKKDKDTYGTDWEGVATELVSVPCTAVADCLIAAADHKENCIICSGTGLVLTDDGRRRLHELSDAHQVVTREGPRKLRWGKGKESESKCQTI